MENTHAPCQCQAPNGSCPRYGWMKGKKWDHCQGLGLTTEQREGYLDTYSGKPRSPGLIQMAKNLITSAIRVAANGFERLGDEAVAKRLEVCHQCPYYNGSDKSCRACGCYVEIKATYRSEPCPLLKWEGDASLVKSKSGCGGCG